MDDFKLKRANDLKKLIDTLRSVCESVSEAKRGMLPAIEFKIVSVDGRLNVHLPWELFSLADINALSDKAAELMLKYREEFTNL